LTVLVFDSGMGGMTVARAVALRLPGADLVYLADTAGFPYGAWDEAQLVERICTVIGHAIDEGQPDCVIVACNTASTIALDALRKRFDVPFIGTVPAIKPAAAATRSGIIGVLATPGTVAREYTKALVDTYAYHCDVILHGCAHLARLAEERMHGREIEDDAVRREIAPVFQERDGRRTDVVVLGCTHYPLLADEIAALAPWRVTYIDPADAIARRAEQVLGDHAAARRADAAVLKAFVTSEHGLELRPVFATFGYRETALLAV